LAGSLEELDDREFTNSVGMEFVIIPPGTFIMGSPYLEEGHGEDETPHEVTLSRWFYMQTTVVTQGQWCEVMDTKPWTGQEWVRDHADHPAVAISWYDCQEFIGKLNGLEATEKYRLPTEAEWEYACRAGSSTRFSCGESVHVLRDHAWFLGTAAKGVGRRYARRVGMKKPNGWGLYDMHGNVWEWCEDRYADYPSGPMTDPTGSSRGSSRVIRGGSWNYFARYCRSAYRRSNPPGFRSLYVGFRLAKSP
jgi:formylglycine-generating enzyme required for sulfatase activity